MHAARVGPPELEHVQAAAAAIAQQRPRARSRQLLEHQRRHVVQLEVAVRAIAREAESMRLELLQLRLFAHVNIHFRIQIQFHFRIQIQFHFHFQIHFQFHLRCYSKSQADTRTERPIRTGV